jgi:hypothetical protein
MADPSSAPDVFHFWLFVLVPLFVGMAVALFAGD